MVESKRKVRCSEKTILYQQFPDEVDIDLNTRILSACRVALS